MRKAATAVIKKLYEIMVSKHYCYHSSHKRLAKRILNSIESAKGKTDPKFIRSADEYACEVLGWAGYAPWLYVYCAVAGMFKEGWIPENYYGRVVIPKIKGKYGDISYLKSLAKMIFKSNDFPDIAYYVNGLFFAENKEILADEEISDFLFKKSDRVVFKTDHSFQGLGIFFFEKNSFDKNQVRLLGNGVFQDYIEQHDFFTKIMPSSVVTLRMTSVIDDSGGVALRACYLRIGRSIDTHVRSDSAIRIAIDVKTGEFSSQGYLTNWQSVDRHPDSGFLFAGQRIPFFDRCVSTVLELHKRMPHNRCIGWDVCVDKNDCVKIMEWNGEHNGIAFSEATQGPCFSGLGWEKFWRKKR